MTKEFARRVVLTIPVLFGVVTIVFFLLHMIPGDPVDIMLGESALPAQREELREMLHLNEPLLSQYGRYLSGLAKGDLGRSIWANEPVLSRIVRYYPSTLKLAAAAMAVAVLISIPLGILAAVRKGTWADTLAMTGSLLGLAMPTFWLGPVLIILFAYRLGWFPISGSDQLLSFVLPAITLGTGMGALLTRMTRASMIDVIEEDFIRTAKAKGLPWWNVLWKHALRNALLPVITIAGLQIGGLLAGSIITEKVFSWPGLGLELVESIERRDYPMVQGCVLVIAVSYVIVNLVTDLAYSWVDPRIRVRQGKSR